jgi:hypothetical protein
MSRRLLRLLFVAAASTAASGCYATTGDYYSDAGLYYPGPYYGAYYSTYPYYGYRPYYGTYYRPYYNGSYYRGYPAYRGDYYGHAGHYYGRGGYGGHHNIPPSHGAGHVGHGTPGVVAHGGGGHHHR